MSESARANWIWVDNDACPKRIRDIILKAGQTRQVPVKLVSNSNMRLPPSAFFEMIFVSGSFDAADDYIVDHTIAGDIVITADLPLADRVVTKGAVGINPRGKLYTPENIKESLMMRNLSHEMRSMSALPSGPSTFNEKDIQLFANAFDREVTKLKKAISS